MSNAQLHVIRCYLRRPPHPGGMEQHVDALSCEQRRLGVRVTDVYNEGDVTGEGVQVLAGLSLCRIRPIIVRDFLFYFGAMIRLHRLHREACPRIVHAHGDWSAFLFARILKHLVGADLLVASIHGKIRRPQLLAWALRGAGLAFSTGKDITKHVGGIRHLPSAPSDVFFEAPKATSVTDVLLVGSLVKIKNYPLLLEVAERLPEVKFSVYGTGPERDHLVDTANLRGINNVEWRGAGTPETIRDALASALLFMNLSLEEGSPTSAMEAMAVGTPVIITPSNDYSTLIGESDAGIVLKGWDCDAIVETLRELLSDNERRNTMSIRARQRAAGERWHLKAQQVTDAITQALQPFAS